MGLKRRILKLVGITDPNDYDSKQNYEILGADFVAMIDAVKSFITANNRNPNLVYIVLNDVVQKTYVTYPKFVQLRAVWDAFIVANNRQAHFVYINVPANKPAPFLQLEQNLQTTINSMDDLINGVVASCNRNNGVYNDIKCMQGAPLTTIIQGVNSKYNNCARWAYLANYAAGVLGVAIKYVHVDCNNSEDEPDPNAGHYLNILTATNTKYDLAHAASSGSNTGTMCMYGYNQNGILDNNPPCP